MKPSDLEMLARYAQCGDEKAFTDLVNRNVNLVYSVALRIVRSPQHAEEVSQSVFIDLAKNATRMKPNTILAAWLYRVTHRSAVDLVRRESCRQRREKAAAEHNYGNMATNSAMEPYLDDALETLPETDRAAIVLRFFQEKSLHEVGAALGISEDAAQKRVSRAVDQLRAFFTKRGIAAGTAGVVAMLGANAAKAAPAGVASGIFTAVSTSMASTAATGTTITLTKGIAIMTITQKIITTAVVTAVAGFTVYEIRNADQKQQQAKDTEAKTQLLERQATAARRKHDAPRADPQPTQGTPIQGMEIQGSATGTPMTFSSSAVAISGNSALAGKSLSDAEIAAKTQKILQALGKHPELMIPELKLLTPEDWKRAIQTFPCKMDTDEDARSTFAMLRMLAKEKVANGFRTALKSYIAANDGQLPDSMQQLADYFPEPLAPAILDRYKLLQSGKASDVPANDYLVGENTDPVDPRNDSLLSVDLNRHNFDNVGKGPSGGGLSIGSIQAVPASADGTPTAEP